MRVRDNSSLPLRRADFSILGQRSRAGFRTLKNRRALQ